jgi:hypothetical protein
MDGSDSFEIIQQRMIRKEGKKEAVRSNEICD